MSMCSDHVGRTVGTIVSAIVLASVIATTAITLKTLIATRAGVPKTASVRVGEALQPIPGLELRAPVTLLMFARGSCPACVASMPVFSSLVAMSDRGSGLDVVLVSNESRSEARRFARSINLAESGILNGSGGIVQVVPTVLLVGSDRRVLGLWQGRLNVTVGVAVTDAVAAVLRGHDRPPNRSAQFHQLGQPVLQRNEDEKPQPERRIR